MSCLLKSSSIAHVVAPTMLGTVLCLAAGGCRTHEPRPLDVPGLAEAFLDRAPVSFSMDLAVGPPGDAADGPTLDLDRAIDIALVFNAELRTRRAEAGVAKAISENAGLWPDPEIGLEFTRIIESIANPNELFGTISFTIPLSGRLEIEKERLGLAHSAELAEIAALEWEVVHELKRRWLTWSAIEAEIGSATMFLDQASSLFEVVATMESLGELPRIEARLFRLAEIRGRETIVALEMRRERARFELFEIMGLPPEVAPVPAPAIDTSLVPDVSDDAPSYRRHPAVVAAVAHYDVAEKLLEEEVRRQWPDLVVGPGYGEQDGYRQFTLGLSLPVPIFNGNRQAIEAAVAEREAAEVRVAAEIERAIARLAEARERSRGAARHLELVRFDLLPLVETQYAEARDLARLGEVNTLILLDSLLQRQQVAIRLIESRREVALAAIDLSAALGPDDVPDVESEASEETTDPPRTERGIDIAAPEHGGRS
jgi:cobalt-zinc-cadmium efflux system outer membrane protein